MATTTRVSGKRLQIDKTNATMVIAIAASAFIVVFSLFATKALLSQRGYQARVISKKEQARDQLKKNIDTASTLETAYKSFVGTPQNLLGGDPNGKGDKDGDNAKIVLDALPSKYDFPALTTSLEKILTQNGLSINSITGTDDEVAQDANSGSNSPQAVDMPFEVSVKGSYDSVKKLMGVFESSIRPFNMNSLQFSGNDSSLTLDIKAKTYYQPEKDLSITTEVVK
jgi:Tfp pilus assembly protein PilO